MLTRNEQVQICKKCVHGYFDLNKGYACKLTNEIATFQEQCQNYEEKIELIKVEKKVEKQPELEIDNITESIKRKYPILSKGKSKDITEIPIGIILFIFIVFLVIILSKIESESRFIFAGISINYLLFPLITYSLNISRWINYHRCKNEMSPKDSFIYKHELRIKTWSEVISVTVGGLILLMLLNRILETFRQNSMKKIERKWNEHYEIEKQNVIF